MSNESLQSYREPPKHERLPNSPPEEDSVRDEVGASSAEVDDTADALAGFALIADPTTISGEPTEPLIDERDVEVERLRSALHSQSQEIETLRQKWGGVTEPSAATPGILSPENPTPLGELIDAASARRLAAEARKRERASREALAATQSELARESDAAPEDRPFAPTISGWQRRALVPARPRSTDAGTPVPARDTTHEPLPAAEATRPATRQTRGLDGGTIADAVDAPAVTDRGDSNALTRPLRAARAEAREFQATLAIARETAIGQRREIATLRERCAGLDERIETLAASLQEADSGSSPDPEEDHDEIRHALENSEREIERLRERLATGERERGARDAERRLLKQTHDRCESTLAARSAELDELRDRFDAQDRALHAARHEYGLERHRRSENLQVLANLRATLADAETETTPSSDLFADRVPRTQMRQPPHANIGAPDFPVDEPSVSTHAQLDEPALEHAVRKTRPAIFENWQDDQIRR